MTALCWSSSKNY